MGRPRSAADAPATAEPAELVGYLAEVGGRLVGAIDLDLAASLVVELAVPVLADCAVLVLPDVRGRLEWWRWSGRGRCVRGRIRRPPAESAPGLHSAMLGRRADLAPSEVAELPRALADPLSGYTTVSALSLPPFDSSVPRGVLVLARGNPDGVAADAVAGFLERASRAVAAAHRFDRQRVAVDELVGPLRPPSLPVLPGIRMAGIYRPASGPLDVGGDFYDLHVQADGSTLFVLGDVCGKGAEAAAMSGRVRQALAALRLVEDNPRQLLRLVNQSLLGTGGSKFATLVIGLAARRSGGSLLLRVSSGGHPSPLVLRRDGTVDVVAVPGMLVGIMEKPEFGENAVDLGPQDTFVLYTDGITEARGAGDELFGSQRLRAALADCVGLPVDRIAARVDEAVRAWTGGESRDDIALLAIQSTPGQ